MSNSTRRNSPLRYIQWDVFQNLILFPKSQWHGEKLRKDEKDLRSIPT